MSLNAVQFDMLCLENSLMKKGGRTWVQHSRHAECQLLAKFYQRHIGKSWLDDNRGALKKNGYHRAWQHGLQRKNGTYDGSRSSRQFTYKAVSALAKRGIWVFRQVFHALKKPTGPPRPQTPQVAGDLAITGPSPQKSGEDRFLDPNFRKKHGFKPTPPGKSD